MRWRLGIVIGIAVALVLAALEVVHGRRPGTPPDGSGGAMPIYHPRVVVDPRMPVIDSMLPLMRGTRPRHSPPLRGWR